MICPRCKRSHTPRADAIGVRSAICPRCLGKPAPAAREETPAASSEAPKPTAGRKKKTATPEA